MKNFVIYLVEDNPIVRASLVEFLNEIADLEVCGYAATQQEGSQWLRAHESGWNLAIVDLFLQQGNGLGVLAACRARAPHQKMVLLTNYATPEIRRRSGQLGVDAVFDKSTQIEGLMDYCVAQVRQSQGTRH